MLTRAIVVRPVRAEDIPFLFFSQVFVSTSVFKVVYLRLLAAYVEESWGKNTRHAKGMECVA
jgi:hypothetical protein